MTDTVDISLTSAPPLQVEFKTSERALYLLIISTSKVSLVCVQTFAVSFQSVCRQIRKYTPETTHNNICTKLSTSTPQVNIYTTLIPINISLIGKIPKLT